MTEQGWLTSKDSLAMCACLYVLGIGERQAVSSLVLPDELREVYGNPFHRYAVHERVLSGRNWSEKGPLDLFRDNLICSREWSDWLTRDVIGTAMAIYKGEPCWACGGTGGGIEKHTGPFNDSDLIHVMMPPQPPCDHCNRTGRVHDFSAMSLVADALEEAGCAEATILQHLRNQEPCPWCNGCGKTECVDWINEQTRVIPVSRHLAKCWRCKGTGIRPVVHTRDCWVLALLIPQEVKA